jgi:iron complex transport system permease protein
MKLAASRRALPLAITLFCLCVLVVLIGISVGSSGFVNFLDAWHDDVSWQIIWDIRIPRTIGAFAAGALLGLAGALAQAVFRNPLADPYLLGSASGAAFGVGLAFVFFGGSLIAAEILVQIGLTGAAFVGAVSAVLLTLLLARGVQHTMRLLLAGIIVGVVMGAATSLLMFIRPDALQNMQGFLLGSTAFVGWSSCWLMLGVLIFCAGLSWGLSFVLDALSLGESTALSLGVPLKKVRTLLVLAMALATATAVAHTGLVAFIGLVAPHIVRSIVSLRQGSLVLLSALMGGLLLLVADVLARAVLAPEELPIGVLTAFLGGGYLLFLLNRNQTQESL